MHEILFGRNTGRAGIFAQSERYPSRSEAREYLIGRKYAYYDHGFRLGQDVQASGRAESEKRGQRVQQQRRRGRRRRRTA